MDIETRIRRAAPPSTGPSTELQQKTLASVLEIQAEPPKKGWSLLLGWFLHYLVRYPIPVLTLGWLVWLMSSRLTSPFGTDLLLSQHIITFMFWK